VVIRVIRMSYPYHPRRIPNAKKNHTIFKRSPAGTEKSQLADQAGNY